MEKPLCKKDQNVKLIRKHETKSADTVYHVWSAFQNQVEEKDTLESLMLRDIEAQDQDETQSDECYDINQIQTY